MTDWRLSVPMRISPQVSLIYDDQDLLDHCHFSLRLLQIAQQFGVDRDTMRAMYKRYFQLEIALLRIAGLDGDLRGVLETRDGAPVINFPLLEDVVMYPDDPTAAVVVELVQFYFPRAFDKHELDTFLDYVFEHGTIEVLHPVEELQYLFE